MPTQIMAKITRKSNQNLLTKFQGPKMQFQDILGRIFFLSRIGAQLLKPINKGQMRKSKHPTSCMNIELYICEFTMSITL